LIGIGRIDRNEADDLLNTRNDIWPCIAHCNACNKRKEDGADRTDSFPGNEAEEAIFHPLLRTVEGQQCDDDNNDNADDAGL